MTKTCGRSDTHLPAGPASASPQLCFRRAIVSPRECGGLGRASAGDGDWDWDGDGDGDGDGDADADADGRTRK